MTPKGLKATSSVIQLSNSLQESGANTFTEEQVNLPLNPLDREVFVITAIDIDVLAPDMVTATNTSVGASLSTTSRTSVGNISSPQVLAKKSLNIRSDATNAVAFETTFGESPVGGDLEYVGIIATDDYFVQIAGVGNAGAKFVHTRIWGYRAQVTDPSVYAALVQSELLS